MAPGLALDVASFQRGLGPTALFLKEDCVACDWCHERHGVT